MALLVSIHAPWEGCDTATIAIAYGGTSFNSRTLGRVRQLAGAQLKLNELVSIHAPWEGCDIPLNIWIAEVSVSIHAPWEGCDRRENGKHHEQLRFNSRTLGRVRPIGFGLDAKGRYVSIHAPWEGCDTMRSVSSSRETFVSIHAPWEGCDHRAHYVMRHIMGFNSRTLGRVRLLAVTFSTFACIVSIHAPWEGCDCCAIVSIVIIRCFNSRTLGRVRLECSRSTLTALRVSIHAPWEGCDTDADCKNPEVLKFQFTHPGKGATYLRPHLFQCQDMFQFTHPGKGATVWCKVAYYRADKQA